MSSPDLSINRKTEPAKLPLDQASFPLLRPQQVQSMAEQASRIKSSLRLEGQPSGGTAAAGEARRTLKRLETQLQEQAPRRYETHEIDDAVKAESTLREQIQAGMPTGEEMRKNPPGAVDKHRAWERRTKRPLLAWKNIRLRLAATGLLKDKGPESHDVASTEALRVHSHSSQLSMDGAQIPGKAFMIPAVIDPKNVMADAERDALAAETQAFMRAFAEASAARRKLVLDTLTGKNEKPPTAAA